MFCPLNMGIEYSMKNSNNTKLAVVRRTKYYLPKKEHILY